jgi:hypothetical protein
VHARLLTKSTRAGRSETRDNGKGTAVRFDLPKGNGNLGESREGISPPELDVNLSPHPTPIQQSPVLLQ